MGLETRRRQMELNPYNSAEATGLAMFTEAQIERAVERRMNGYDARLMNGSLPQAVYDCMVSDLNDWSERMYRKVAR